jgi:hypothetical protein
MCFKLGHNHLSYSDSIKQKQSLYMCAQELQIKHIVIHYGKN